MRRALVIAGAAGAGLLAAVLVMGQPDTGASTAAPRPSAPGPSLVAAVNPDQAPSDAPKEASPATEALAAAHAAASARAEERATLRSSPEFLEVSVASAAWRVIQRDLGQLQDPAAAQLVPTVADLVRDLREARSRPEVADLEELAARQADLFQRVQALPNLPPGVTDQLDRLAREGGASR